MASQKQYTYSSLPVAGVSKSSSMDPIMLSLCIAIGVLMVDSIIELSFISSMVAWLHSRAGGSFDVYDDTQTVVVTGDTFSLHGKPEYLLVNQGHTSNGAAGTAFVLIGLGGILALYLRSRVSRQAAAGGFGSKLALGWYHFWLVMTVPALLLTLSALIYTFVITNNHWFQQIDINVASQLHNRPYPNQDPYPLDQWTPENWFSAVLKLNLRYDADISDIKSHLRVMKGWRWNLIPMFIIQLATTVLAVMEALRRRRSRNVAPPTEGKRLSA